MKRVPNRECQSRPPLIRAPSADRLFFFGLRSLSGPRSQQSSAAPRAQSSYGDRKCGVLTAHYGGLPAFFSTKRDVLSLVTSDTCRRRRRWWWWWCYCSVVVAAVDMVAAVVAVKDNYVYFYSQSTLLVLSSYYQLRVQSPNYVFCCCCCC